jgi:hypothetical protein
MTKMELALEIALEISSWTAGSTLRDGTTSRLAIASTDGKVIVDARGWDYDIATLYTAGWRKC